MIINAHHFYPSTRNKDPTKPKCFIFTNQPSTIILSSISQEIFIKVQLMTIYEGTLNVEMV